MRPDSSICVLEALTMKYGVFFAGVAMRIGRSFPLDASEQEREL